MRVSPSSRPHVVYWACYPDAMRRMPHIRRTLVALIAVTMLVATLIYVEHPAVRPLKGVVAALGMIDSRHTLVGMTDVRSIDHVRGGPDTPVTLIEYSNFTCVMCAAMQGNFDRIVREQGARVVSRNLSPNTAASTSRAVAAECVAKHAGEDAYFTFSRYLYANQHSDPSTVSEDALTKQAISLGADALAFRQCIAGDESVREKIRLESEEALRLGARGTPYIVVVYRDMPVGISYANEYGRFLDRVRLLITRAEK